MNYSIGVDFDGTIVIYDELFYDLAIQKNLISLETPKIKKEIRNQIQRLPNGDAEWQKLQAIVYGEKIKEANPAEGVLDFFDLCKRNDIKINIISHKTRYSNSGESKIDFIISANEWLKINGFFDKNLISGDNVFFEPTRKDKIRKIKDLNCTHFIDDLEEIFSEEEFPQEVKKILYAQNKPNTTTELTTDSWNEITKYFFK